MGSGQQVPFEVSAYAHINDMDNLTKGFEFEHTSAADLYIYNWYTIVFDSYLGGLKREIVLPKWKCHHVY